MRIVFMGNPVFAIPTLETLLNSNHEIVAVVSNPIKRIGRNNKESLTPVGDYAQKYNLNNINPESLKSVRFKEELISLKPDIFVVVAFRILPSSLINLPRFGSVNLHASLLPKYRGAGPIQWALMNGDKTTGITIFQIQPTIDSGDILYQKKVEIYKNDDMQSLGIRLCKIGANSMLNVLTHFEKGTIQRQTQNVREISLAPKITKEMLIINWFWTAEKIHNWVRGLSPSPGMYTIYKGKKLGIFKTEIKKGSGRSGKILELNKNNFLIGTGKGIISILELQLEGRKKMEIKNFLMGSYMKKGEILGK